MELEWPLSKDRIAEFTETCCTSFHLTGVSCSTDRTTDRAASTRSQQVLLACDFRGLASCTRCPPHCPDGRRGIAARSASPNPGPTHDNQKAIGLNTRSAALKRE